MALDKQGLLNPRGLWNKRGAWLGGVVAGGALVGFNYFYFEEMLAALVLFIAVWLPLLLAAFLLATFELAGEVGFLRSDGSGQRTAARRTAPARTGAVGRPAAEIVGGFSSQDQRREIGGSPHGEPDRSSTAKARTCLRPSSSPRRVKLPSQSLIVRSADGARRPRPYGSFGSGGELLVERGRTEAARPSTSLFLSLPALPGK